MRRCIAVWVLMLFLCGLGMTGAAIAQAQEAVTIEGEVVDLACYMSKGSRGSAHKACALMCAKKGIPMGVLTDGGDVLLLLEDHDNPDPYDAAKKLAGERVQVTGKRFTAPGINGIVVGSVKGL